MAGDELASLDFESLIGGPLSAVVRAQTQAAMTSVDFIKAVGFTLDDQNKPTAPVMVTFAYDRPQDAGNGVVEIKPFTLTVPFLTMLPVPFIRIEETTIDFNAKITSVIESATASEHGLKTDLQVKAGWGFGSAKLKVNYSYKRTSSASNKIERTYSMAVHVRAVQDELPAGTERLLGILENTIKEVPRA